MVRELMLIENPLRGRRGKNPVYVAPYGYTRRGKRVHVPGYVKHLPGERNLRGGNMRRNPNGVQAMTKQWFQGVDLMDMGAALGGLTMATLVPGMFVKETATTGQKWLKVGAGALAAIGAGWIFRNVSPTAGKYAIAGGLAGTLQQALSAFGIVQIGRTSGYLGRRRSLGGVYPESAVSDETRIITNVT